MEKARKAQLRAFATTQPGRVESMETPFGLNLKEWVMLGGVVVFLIGLLFAGVALKNGQRIPAATYFLGIVGLGTFFYSADLIQP